MRGALSPERLALAVRCAAALVFLVAWRFRRGRIAWAAVALVAVHEALGPLSPLLPETRALVADAVSVLAPTSLAVLAFLSEWPVASLAGLGRFTVLGAQAAAIGFLARPGASPLVEHLRAPLLGLEPAAGSGVWAALATIQEPVTDTLAMLPQAGWVAFGLTAVLLIWRVHRAGHAIDAGLLGLLAALLAVLVASARGSAVDVSWWTATGTVILGLSLLENAFSLAFEDGLTGLPARRALDETLRHLTGTYAIAMVDLDHFKKFNDRHGHEVGDQVLKMVAGRIRKVSSGGQPFRYGGEEICVLFPGKTAADAEPALEELRRSISDQAFTVRSPGRPKSAKRGQKSRGRGGDVTKRLKVTVSIGVAQRDGKKKTPEQVMKAADKALYRSKKAGRNRVTVG